jgi:hypothetical protein
MGVQKHKKRKLPKNQPKKSKLFFCRFCLITFLGFSRRGEFENTTKQFEQKCLTVPLFWPLTHLPITGVPGFLFWRLALARWHRRAVGGWRGAQMPVSSTSKRR